MFGLGIGELVVIAVFALIFIGPKKLPELAKGLGRGIREFQKAKDEIVNSVKDPDYGTDKNQTVSDDASKKVLNSSKENTDLPSDPDNNEVDPSILTEVEPKLTSIARGDLDKDNS